ncbi:MAG: group 1 glycosyl transferase [Parcubacteria group bacterium LiPW_30]|nr:MAG: group 1 glycosyl transferase [Parcubacteria group bacterium LiPW_30]
MLSLYRIYLNKILNKLFGVVQFPAKRKKKGDILISYITEPFTKKLESFSNLHTNYWECYEIARLFSVRGYTVDIINWDNHKFIPKKNYKICIDTQNNLEHLSKFLPKSCIKVMHVVTSHGDFQNNAELKRLEELKKRRKIVLSPQRQMLTTKNLKYVDFLEGFGNKSVHKTYNLLDKQIFPIPISAVKLFNFPENKDFKSARTKFLWLGGGGAILKGLDLVLEVFAKNPSLELHICGPIVAEKDFALAYKKELYETPNIHFYGRIDVTSDLFGEISNKCGALIYPAFSEGTSGAIVQAMHAGIIPIITPQCGVYEDANAIIIQDPSINSINESVNSFSKLDPETVKNMARNIWAYAQKHYTRESFSATYSKFIDTILKI